MVNLKTILLVLLVLSFSVLADAQVVVEIDRNSIEQDETFNATYTFAGDLNGEPDFSPLEKDFRVISQNRRSNLQIINGNTEYELSWVLTLAAKRVGELTLPPIQFGSAQSGDVSITVEPAAQASGADLGDIFLETAFEPEQGYVQGQYIFTVRIFFRGWLTDGELSPPDIGGQDVVVKSLGEPRRYSKMRNGQRYQVFERRHALFPQSSGELELGLTIFSGRLRLPNGSTRLKRATAPGLTATVKASPSNFSGKVWLPARNVEIVEVWPQDLSVFEQGVPITRTITLKADGLSHAQLPNIDLPQTDAVRVYPGQPATSDRVTDKGMQGERTESFAFVPQQAGEVVLPAIKVFWWDTVNDRERIAELPQRILSVAPRNGARSISNPAIKADATTLVSQGAMTWKSNPWFWATLFCALGWLVSLVRSKNGALDQSTNTDQPIAFEPKRNNSSIDNIKKKLKFACMQNNAAEARELAEEYLRELFAMRTQPLTSLEWQFDQNMTEQWKDLNRVLYGPDSEAIWQGGPKFWETLDQVKVQVDKKPVELLQPL